MVLLKDIFKVIVLILYPIFFLGLADPEKIYQAKMGSQNSKYLKTENPYVTPEYPGFTYSSNYIQKIHSD